MTPWNDFVQLNGIKKRFASVSLATADKLPREIIEKGKELIHKPVSLVLTGQAGRGKTYFSYCLARGLIERYGIASTRWFKSKTLDDRLVEDTKKYGSCSYTIQCLIEVNFLFIDDFGMDRSTERSERDYYELIDGRWEDERITIISTNLNAREIENQYGKRIFSRFKDFRWMIFDGPDLRGEN